MADQNDTDPVTILVSRADLQLILTSLKFLLSAEDDPVEIEGLKALIDRFEGR